MPLAPCELYHNLRWTDGLLRHRLRQRLRFIVGKTLCFPAQLVVIYLNSRCETDMHKTVPVKSSEKN